ncbi:unnamed protein product, partial [Tuber aestivum]
SQTTARPQFGIDPQKRVEIGWLQVARFLRLCWACSASFSSRLRFISASTSPCSRMQAVSLLRCLRSAFPLAVICLTSSRNLVKTDHSLIDRGLLNVIADSPST